MAQKHTEDADLDVISIKNLQFPGGIIEPDVWGRPARPQPGLISVRIELSGDGFRSAANADALDASTLNYGTLAKEIRTAVTEETPPIEACEALFRAHCVIRAMAFRNHSAAPSSVARVDVEVDLPHASMAGDGFTVGETKWYTERGYNHRRSMSFSVRNVQIMTIVGLNAHERKKKQPLVVSLQLNVEMEPDTIGWIEPEDYIVLFSLEDRLVKIIEATDYGTLETLAELTVQRLRGELLDRMFQGARIHLRIEKPRAIPFADAPAVEIWRKTPGAEYGNAKVYDDDDDDDDDE